MKNTIQHTASCADDFDPSSISVAKAKDIIHQAIQPITGKEKRALRNCLNRIVADDIHSPVQVPAHTNSAMDGYALAGTDLPTDTIKDYKIIGTAYAGTTFSGCCKAGEVIRIMTGAVIPNGCDTVVMQEQVERIDDDYIKIGQGHRIGQNVRHAGEDIPLGGVVLKAGRRITPADLGIIASLGIAEISVYRRPRIAFFSTGDELRSVGETLAEGEIYDSNRYTLYGMLQQLDVDIIDMGVIKDDPDSMHKAFVSASEMADVIITSGGVSVGEADYIKPTLKNLGKTHFWKVSIKPGRPLTFGKVNKAHFFGLPGNPVAVMVTFYQFIQPALHYLASGNTHTPITLKARCQSVLKKRAGRVECQRGIYQQNDTGELLVKKTGKQGSGILSSMSQANCFILLPEESTGVKEGETVDIQPFIGLV